MPPEGYMPRWERDFWDTLMEEQHVTFPGGWSVPKEQVYGVPDAFFYANNIPDQPFVSPYATEGMLVGEIVDETLAVES